MARKTRRTQWNPGGTYHIIVRGVRKLELFQHEEDRLIFLMQLKKAKEENDFAVHAYCLMTNHIHLLIETKDAEMWTFMKQILQNYAMYYNQKYGYKGHVYEERYNSFLIKSEVIFLKTSRYIHMNPVAAQMVRYPEIYRWSSYGTIIGIAQDDISDCTKILSFFDNNIRAYREFVENEENAYFL